MEEVKEGKLNIHLGWLQHRNRFQLNMNFIFKNNLKKSLIQSNYFEKLSLLFQE